jgi:hypothetical protein
MTAALGNEVPRISRHQRVGLTRDRNFEEWHISVVRQDHGEWTRSYVLRERCERVEHAGQVSLGKSELWASRDFVIFGEDPIVHQHRDLPCEREVEKLRRRTMRREERRNQDVCVENDAHECVSSSYDFRRLAGRFRCARTSTISAAMSSAVS